MMGTPGGPQIPDLSSAEIVDFTVESGENRVRLKLKDGSVLEVKMEIVNILRAGSDPNTGLPNYVVQATNILRLVSCPKELRKPPLRPGTPQGQKFIPGFS
jgi:hypothetical protein